MYRQLQRRILPLPIRIQSWSRYAYWEDFLSRTSQSVLTSVPLPIYDPLSRLQDMLGRQ